MPGAPDPLYVLARRALLDTLEALEPHLGSLVVVGAQAVYEHTGPASLAVAEFTVDADLTIVPEILAGAPGLIGLLEAKDFERQDDPGKWKTADGIQVDLLVPEAVAGPGRRGRACPVTASGPLAARRASRASDALDVLRILRAIATDDLASGIHRLLASDVARDVTREALHLGQQLLGSAEDAGTRMAVRAVGGLEDDVVIAASLNTLWSDLHATVDPA